MKLSSRAAWLFGALLAWHLGSGVEAAGILEVDLVFPRHNGTYAPTTSMPIVFAFQNAQLARWLMPKIRYYIFMQGTAMLLHGQTFEHNYTANTNWSSHEPYLAYTYFNDFKREGAWELFWSVFWHSCDEGGSGRYEGLLSNHTGRKIEFSMVPGGQEVDLVAMTANKTTCSEQAGIAINVTNTTMSIPPGDPWGGEEQGTCAVVASSSPTPTADPCRVAINSAVAASMSAASSCHSLNPPSNCPSSESAGQRLGVAGMACLASAIGAFGFLMA